MSVLETATQKTAAVRGAGGVLLTEPFLEVCRLVLPVIDKLGTAFALVRSDINGNIQRLADRAAQDPARYTQLFTIVQDEIVNNSHSSSSSCTKGLLWLKRAMEFTVAILKRTHDDPTATMVTAVGETYSKTLQQYHGFMVSSAFSLAFRFVPSREYFMEHLGSGDMQQQIADFVAAFSPLLEDVHKFLGENNLDDPAKV